MKKCKEFTFFKDAKDPKYPGLCWSCRLTIKTNKLMVALKAKREKLGLK